MIENNKQMLAELNAKAEQEKSMLNL